MPFNGSCTCLPPVLVCWCCVRGSCVVPVRYSGLVQNTLLNIHGCDPELSLYQFCKVLYQQVTMLQGSLTLLAGSIEMQPKQPEFPQHGELPVTVTYCSSLLMFTDRYITKTKQVSTVLHSTLF